MGVGRGVGPLQEDVRGPLDGVVVFLGVIEVVNVRCPEGAALDDTEETLGVV
jgi:hypothetical protein